MDPHGGPVCLAAHELPREGHFEWGDPMILIWLAVGCNTLSSLSDHGRLYTASFSGRVECGEVGDRQVYCARGHTCEDPALQLCAAARCTLKKMKETSYERIRNGEDICPDEFGGRCLPQSLCHPHQDLCITSQHDCPGEDLDSGLL